MSWPYQPVLGGGERGDVLGGEREVHDIVAGQALVYRRQVERDAVAVESREQVEEAERVDLRAAGFLQPTAVVAPQGESVLGREVARAGRRVTRRPWIAHVTRGCQPLKGFRFPAQECLLDGGEGGALNGAIGGERGGVGGRGDATQVVASKQGVIDRGAGHDQGRQLGAYPEAVVSVEEAEQVQG